jgi:hypothetical protein
MGEGRRVDAAVDKDQVVEMGIEGVPLQPVGMVDKGAVAAEFLHEDPVAQGLRGGQVIGRRRQPHGIGGRFGRHRLRLRLSAGLT